MVLEGNCGLPEMTTDELQSKMTSFKECVCVVCRIRPAISISIPVTKYDNNFTRVESISVQDNMNWNRIISKINDEMFDDNYPLRISLHFEHQYNQSEYSDIHSKK